MHHNIASKIGAKRNSLFIRRPDLVCLHRPVEMLKRAEHTIEPLLELFRFPDKRGKRVSFFLCVFVGKSSTQRKKFFEFLERYPCVESGPIGAREIHGFPAVAKFLACRVFHHSSFAK